MSRDELYEIMAEVRAHQTDMNHRLGIIEKDLKDTYVRSKDLAGMRSLLQDLKGSRDWLVRIVVTAVLVATLGGVIVKGVPSL